MVKDREAWHAAVHGVSKGQIWVSNCKTTIAPVFIAALFTIDVTSKQPRCPSTNEWIRKLWYMYTMEYCLLVRSLSHVWLFCNPMDCSPPGSYVHGVFQVRILGCVATSSTGDLPHPGIEPGFSALQFAQILYQVSHQGSSYKDMILFIKVLLSLPLKDPTSKYNNILY